MGGSQISSGYLLDFPIVACNLQYGVDFILVFDGCRWYMTPYSPTSGSPSPRDPAQGLPPIPSPCVNDRWIISDSGTLPPPIGPVVPGDYIIYDCATSTWTLIHNPNSSHYQLITVTAPGQTSFVLTAVPTSLVLGNLYINGAKQLYGIDYTVIGLTLTRLNINFILDPTDVVEYIF